MATFVDNEVVRSIIHLLLEEDKAQQAWSVVISSFLVRWSYLENEPTVFKYNQRKKKKNSSIISADATDQHS
jgi:hypothetical protein